MRILLADDAPVVRQGVRALLEREGFEIVGEATDGHEAVRLAQALHPDVAILDLSMPHLNGLDAAREIHQVCPRIHLIVLSVHTDEHLIVRAFWVGIRGYVVKARAAEDLAWAVEEVSRGRTFCPLSRPGVTCAICGLCPSTAPWVVGPTPPPPCASGPRHFPRSTP